MNVAYYLIAHGHTLSYAINLDEHEKWIIAGMLEAKNRLESEGVM